MVCLGSAVYDAMLGLGFVALCFILVLQCSFLIFFFGLLSWSCLFWNEKRVNGNGRLNGQGNSREPICLSLMRPKNRHLQ